ncbi:hypothetical protein ACJMK2_005035 [Sinanodonta woodiana]|uniref:NACHT domain-containing protein n=1 Tax=Sinanodonta woodiana TaxID=1069815 RepID=A0ABD3VNU6_SINWO
MPPTAAATKVKEPEYSNWLKVSLALYYLTVGLHSFIQGEVDAMHQYLLQKLYGGSGVPKPKCSSCISKDVKQNKSTYVWKFKSSCPSHLCDIWLAELLTRHTNPTSNKIYWDNCDVTAWPFVPWECAKLYMPRGQLPANTGPVKCDSQALLTLMANCKCFHGKLSPAGLGLTHTISKIRNSVMHSEEMRLSDRDSKSYIQDIIHLLEDPAHLKSLEECKQAVNEINKIDKDSIAVFFNEELERLALRTAVNALRQDLGKHEERTLGSVESLKEEYVQLEEEMRTKIATVENRLGIVENRQDIVEDRQDTIEKRQDTVENQVVTVENRQDTVEDRQDTVEKRQDTVENKVVTVENRQDTFENRVGTVENRQDTFENRVGTVENRQDTIGRDVESALESLEKTTIALQSLEKTTIALQSLENEHKEMQLNVQSVMEKTQQQMELSQAISARVEAVEETSSLQESGSRTVENIACKEGIIKLQDDLIKAYINLRCVQVSPIFEKKRCGIDSIYGDIDIEEEQESRNMEEESKYITQHKNAQPHSKKTIKVTSYKQIFLDEQGFKFKRVYLQGKGGLGKTTFCRKVLHAWCNAHENRVTAHDNCFQDEAVLQTFDLLFYLNLREVSKEETLIEVICNQLPLQEIPNKNGLETLLNANGDKVLFILDGLDEMIVKPKFLENIITRRVYPDCCFLVSSRPWKISQMELQEGTEIDLLLDLKGFSKENAIKCATNIFKNCYKDAIVIDKFIKDIEGNKLAKQLIHVPLLLLILTQVWYENNMSLPSKLHDLYILFLNLLTSRLTKKYKKDPNHRQMRFIIGDMQSPLPTKISETSLVVNFGEGLFRSLCEVAHHFLLSRQKENSLVFEKTELLNILGDSGKEKLKIALDLGVLSMTDSVSYLYRKMNVSFMHKTLQEFFTAVCLIVCPNKLANFVSSIADCNDVKQNEYIIVFLVGLMPEFGNSVLEKINQLCRDDWEVLKRHELMNPEIPYYLFLFFLPNIYGDEKCYFRLSNIMNIYLRCNDNVMGENVLLNVSGLLLKQNVFNPQPWNPSFLQNLNLTGTQSSDYSLVDLRGLTGLEFLTLKSLTCELYLPESGSLCTLIMMSLKLASCCCDVLGRTLIHCTGLKYLAIHKTNLQKCVLDLSNMTKLTTLHMSEVTLSSSCCDVMGSTLTHCTKLECLLINKINLYNCALDLSNMKGLTFLDISEVTLSSSCCDVLGRTLTNCTKLWKLKINKIDLHNCILDLSNMTGLTFLDMSKVTLFSSCDVRERTLTHCTKLDHLKINNTDLHNCVLDLSNMSGLTFLNMSKVTLSSSSCDVLGRTLTHCTKLESLKINNTDLHNCVLDLSNMTGLTSLNMSKVTLSSSCCDVLGRTLTHCTKLESLKINKIDLHNCVLDLSNMIELTSLDMSEVTLSSSSCDVLGRTLTHCTKLESLKINKIDLLNCVLDLSNLTELRNLYMLEVRLSSRCCDVIGSTLTHCTKLSLLMINNIDLHNCVLDLSNMTGLTSLDMLKITLSSSCCDVLGRTLTHCTKLKSLTINNIDLHNCVLDLSNMTELKVLNMSDVTLSSSSCDVIGSTLTHCTKLWSLTINNIDLHNCVLDLTNMTELTSLDMSEVTLSSSCCDVLGRTLTNCIKLLLLNLDDMDINNCMLDLSMTQLLKLRLNEVTLSNRACQVLEQSLDQLKDRSRFIKHRTLEKLPSANDKWKVNFH